MGHNQVKYFVKNFGGPKGGPKKDYVDSSTELTEDPEGEPDIEFLEKYKMQVNGKQTIEIVSGDIADEPVDVIVNSVNKEME